jgi:hypothetical protein
MDSELREAYERMAGDARDYTNADRVIRAARRRRTRREILAGVAVLAVVAGGGLAGVQLADGGRGLSPPAAAPAASPSTRSPAGVRHVTPPATVPPLPGAPVGSATLLYQMCPGTCPTIVLLASGAQYRLPSGDAIDLPVLSPDGNLVGYRDADGYVVRRLTDTKVWRVPAIGDPFTPIAWAPGSDALLLRSKTGFTLLDLRDGTQRQVGQPSGSFVAVSDRRLPLASRSGFGRLELAELQPDNTLRTVLDVDLTAYLGGGTIVKPGAGGLNVANYALSGGLAVAVFDTGTGPVGVIRLGANGQFAGRVDTPTGGGEWAYLGPCDGELAYQHLPGDGMPVELVVVRPSGPPIVVLTLPAGAAMRLPGAAA